VVRQSKLKANKKTRQKKAVTSTIGTVLMIPVVMMIITAMLLWSQNIFSELEDAKRVVRDIRAEMEQDELDLDVLISEGSIVRLDDFEGTQQWYIQAPGSGLDFSHSNNFYTKGHSLEIDTEAEINRPFSAEPFEKVCFEFRFTVDPDEEYKNFSIYENNNNNKGVISIDLKNNKLLVLNGVTDTFFCFKHNIQLNADKYCWHHIRIIVDFETEKNSKESHYVGITLNNDYYSLNKYKLKNPTYDGISSSSIYISYKTTDGVNPHYIDDFILRDLERVD